MVTDLERIGDLAVNICERAVDLCEVPHLATPAGLQRMAELTQSMVRDSIDAFVAADAGKARDVIVRDREVDELYQEVFRETLGRMVGDTSVVERGIHIQSVAKWLERMADHATNLAEQVIFHVQGEDVRHARGSHGV
jgi:phosphate transport system protein